MLVFLRIFFRELIFNVFSTFRMVVYKIIYFDNNNLYNRLPQQWFWDRLGTMCRFIFNTTCTVNISKTSITVKKKSGKQKLHIFQQ